MGKHLLFAGGGHAHLTALKNLSAFTKRGHRVTLVSPSPYHYYSGMGPGMFSGMYDPREVRFNIKKMAESQGATFVEEKVVGVDPSQHLLILQSGRKIGYDIVSFNTGSEVPVDVLTRSPQENIVTVKPVINLLKARQMILGAIGEGKALRCVLIGGGPAGLEISANLWRLLNQNKGRGEIVLIAGERLMPNAPSRVREIALDSLSRRGVQVVEGSMVKSVEARTVLLSDGRRFDFDVAFAAIGIRPSSLFRDSGVPTGQDGGLLVNAQLQSVAHPDMFGGGDCISLEGRQLAKVGVYAVRQNPILFHNLQVALDGGEMMTFTPQKEYLLISNLGNGKGIFWKKNWVWDGRLAFLIKDYIDRRFMKAFQVSGERDERTERDR
jgi:NADH dehydrogenase FAD-containing subunit